MAGNPLKDLPYHILLRIVSLIDREDLLTLSRVDQFCCAICADESLWTGFQLLVRFQRLEKEGSQDLLAFLTRLPAAIQVHLRWNIRDMTQLPLPPEECRRLLKDVHGMCSVDLAFHSGQVLDVAFETRNVFSNVPSTALLSQLQDVFSAFPGIRQLHIRYGSLTTLPEDTLMGTKQLIDTFDCLKCITLVMNALSTRVDFSYDWLLEKHYTVLESVIISGDVADIEPSKLPKLKNIDFVS